MALLFIMVRSCLIHRTRVVTSFLASLYQLYKQSERITLTLAMSYMGFKLLLRAREQVSSGKSQGGRWGGYGPGSCLLAMPLTVALLGLWPFWVAKAPASLLWSQGLTHHLHNPWHPTMLVLCANIILNNCVSKISKDMQSMEIIYTAKP